MNERVSKDNVEIWGSEIPVETRHVSRIEKNRGKVAVLCPLGSGGVIGLFLELIVTGENYSNSLNNGFLPILPDFPSDDIFNNMDPRLVTALQ